MASAFLAATATLALKVELVAPGRLWYIGRVTKEERAEQRRLRWSGGVLDSEGHKNIEGQFWRTASAEQRLSAVWEMAQQVWFNDGNTTPLRLDRTIGGIRRYGG